MEQLFEKNPIDLIKKIEQFQILLEKLEVKYTSNKKKTELIQLFSSLKIEIYDYLDENSNFSLEQLMN